MVFYFVDAFHEAEVVLAVEVVVVSGEPGGQREGVVHQRVVDYRQESGRRSQTQPGGRRCEKWEASGLGKSLPLNVWLHAEFHSLYLSQELHQVVLDISSRSTSGRHVCFCVFSVLYLRGLIT